VFGQFLRVVFKAALRLQKKGLSLRVKNYQVLLGRPALGERPSKRIREGSYNPDLGPEASDLEAIRKKVFWASKGALVSHQAA